ncbi:MAG TPA: alpha/beta hydrolase [Streptosporangiaceae bacterium]|nr:alpha/beta hydrolase [Streptosporangiaceae bacterium]
MRHSFWVRRAGGAALGVLLIATLGAVGTGTAPAAVTPRSSAAVPALTWQACAGEFECATAAVPLDYDAPRGRAIDIAVIRHRAADPARRIGSLFFNPGGPGGSGTQALPLFFSLFPQQVKERFDIVSFDPRGIGESTSVQCYPNAAAEQEALAGLPAGFPVGRAEQRTWIRLYADFARSCGARAAELIPHVSTANVARDMDLLRQAVGDQGMNYLGISYGSYLGATYANLFPGRVRALILDGNIDPVAAATGRGEARRLAVTLRFGQDQGMAATVRAFLDLCGAADPAACAFSAGSPAATRGKYATLLRRLRANPVTIGGQVFTYPLVVGLSGVLVYATHPRPGLPGWSGTGALLQQLWAATEGAPAGAAAVSPEVARATVAPPAPLPALRPAIRQDDATEKYTGPEQQIAPVCADTPNPRDPRSYAAQAAFAFARSGPFGPFRAWAIEPCATWPVMDADRYTGPWDRPTARPVLVVNITTDPGTPYANGVAMARELHSARLLTVNGYGHTALFNKSACADAIESAYLIDGTLPPAGATCEQDRQPFS